MSKNNIGIIDADLIGRKKHRFPNLACLKISGYHKSIGDKVTLLMSYDDIEDYDKVYISKVFMDSKVPDLSVYNNIEYGGTGFYYDKADPLPDCIEHHMPDYHLYDEWVEDMINNGSKKVDLKYYIHYSIGFTTRGCFRQCKFCINQNYKIVQKHSPISEFFDPSRKYICLLDDNILGYSYWKDIFNELKQTNKRFEYKQGMDMRLMTEEKAFVINHCKYNGDKIFAFDNIEEKEILEKRFKIWNRHWAKGHTKLYVLCGFNGQDEIDIANTFERIRILMKNGYYSYVMRYEKYKESKYRGIYVSLARWCNQPNFYYKKSFREWCILDSKGNEKYSSLRYLIEFEKEHPDIAKEYFDMKYSDITQKNKIHIDINT